MPEDDFKPRLGRIRDQRTAKSIRHSTRVIEEVSRNVARPQRRRGHINPNAHRRGMASGVVAATGGWTPGTRRVVVPLLDPKRDGKALRKLQELFPKREVVGVPGREILLGGGNVHCVTQQVPLARHRSA